MSKAITPGSSAALIIIDEFGRSTEASDGKALLAASLNHFLRRGPAECPHVLTTTHFYGLTKMLIDTPLVIEQVSSYTSYPFGRPHSELRSSVEPRLYVQVGAQKFGRRTVRDVQVKIIFLITPCHESRAPWSRSLEHCQTRFPAVLTLKHTHHSCHCRLAVVSGSRKVHSMELKILAPSQYSHINTRDR